MGWIKLFPQANKLTIVSSLIEGVMKIANINCIDVSNVSIQEDKQNLWSFQSCSQ